MLLFYLFYAYPILQVRVKPGESALAFYTAENKSSTPITGVSTYNVTPMKVYELKLKIFCLFIYIGLFSQKFNFIYC